MAIKERIQEPVAALARPEHLVERIRTGWRLVGLEWEREVAEPSPLRYEEWVEEIPYGLRISNDGARLVQNPRETEVIVHALDLIVEDWPLSRVADRLNQSGYRTREGGMWTAAALFELLPRMIEVGPRLFTTEEWITRRRHLPDPAS
ncbi:MAG TPA: recombinase family protein [Bryobacteraceae bacterium]|jgi:hypothetical protein|nr:recombinase family protein [Bryobacteraceae bacterium]